MMKTVIAPEMVVSASTAEMPASSALTTSSILRRSSTSAKTPPTSEKISRGMACISPMIPSATAECVSRNTCQAITTTATCVPAAETSCPQKSSA